MGTPATVTSTTLLLITVLFDMATTSLSDPLAHLKRIEAILRNGLPTDDKAEANTITNAHSEIEKLLESINPDWWLK